MGFTLLREMKLIKVWVCPQTLVLRDLIHFCLLKLDTPIQETSSHHILLSMSNISVLFLRVLIH